MSVEDNRLDLGQQRILPIDVSPPDLNHADFRITEVIDHVFQKIFSRYEVCVEDCNELSACQFQAVLQCARLKSTPVCTVNVMDIEAECPVLLNALRGDVLCPVG